MVSSHISITNANYRNLFNAVWRFSKTFAKRQGVWAIIHFFRIQDVQSATVKYSPKCFEICWLTDILDLVKLKYSRASIVRHFTNLWCGRVGWMKCQTIKSTVHTYVNVLFSFDASNATRTGPHMSIVCQVFRLSRGMHLGQEFLDSTKRASRFIVFKNKMEDS